jgi:hypothetical protein
VPGFAYAIFGTIKEATVGPTAVNALMSYNYAGTSVTAALTLSFFTGLIEIAAGILNLGKSFKILLMESELLLHQFCFYIKQEFSSTIFLHLSSPPLPRLSQSRLPPVKSRDF